MTDIPIEDIKRIVSLQLGARQVSDDSRLVEDLGAESADLMNIVLVLEEKYRITIKEAETARIHTPVDLQHLVNQKLSS